MPRGADGPLDWVQQPLKRELVPGDHVYSWKLGYAYNHHGIVARVENCSPDCAHDTLSCCSIVHFLAPSGENRGRIELTSLAGFVQGRGICRCRYGVPSAEFYFRRSGSCSTYKEDVWAFAVLRALSVLDIGSPDGDIEDPAAIMEYDLLRKNAELLACWCKVGNTSGVRRFRSDETAYSSQTSPGRFVRLGLAGTCFAGVAAGAVAAVGAATGAGATAATATGATVAGAEAAAVTAGAAGAGGTVAGAGVAGAGAVTSTSATVGTSLAAGSIAARTAIGAAGRQVLNAGSLAASSVAQNLLMDALKRPEHAQTVLRQVQEVIPVPTLIAGNGGYAAASSSSSAAAGLTIGAVPTSTSGSRGCVDRDRSYRGEQQAALVSAVQACLNDLGVHVPKPIGQLLNCPLGCSRLCEMLVDLLEASGPEDVSVSTVLIQSFLDELHG